MSDGNLDRRPAPALPQPLAEPPPIPYPQDRDYPGVIVLRLDLRDVERCIYRVHETIPVETAGPMILLYPKWTPGFHSPACQIELLAGLDIRAGNARLDWRRDPVEMHAFHIDVPEGAEALEIEFQFLAPTAKSQGELITTPVMAMVNWCSLSLYPAGHFSRRIRVQPSLELPEGWSADSALETVAVEGARIAYAPSPYNVLVDCPVLAGRWARTIDLDDTVRLHLTADRKEMLEVSDEQLAPHRAVIAEADALFGPRPFDHYTLLTALSDELGGAGVEHRRSAQIVVPSRYFADWQANAPRRSVFPHEYVHAWNGKFRRGADSWTPSFERPIRNSLMWVYEGQTQYWGEVLAARSGLWTAQQALDTLARTAAIYAGRPGGAWRPMSDTTRDPIITERQPQPWASWQRNEDYYSEGQLLWLDADTLIRERSGDTRSLDDFARAFFHADDPCAPTSTYGFEDVVAALGAVQPHDWAGFLSERLEARRVGAPLDGLERGGYRLVYRPEPNDFGAATDAGEGILNLRFSVGLSIGGDGTLQEVIWDSPAFQAGLVAGAKVLAVNGLAYERDVLKDAITAAQGGGPLELLVERGQRYRTARIEYRGGLRFPHLEPIEGARPRLLEILAPRRPDAPPTAP